MAKNETADGAMYFSNRVNEDVQKSREMEAAINKAYIAMIAGYYGDVPPEWVQPNNENFWKGDGVVTGRYPSPCGPIIMQFQLTDNKTVDTFVIYDDEKDTLMTSGKDNPEDLEKEAPEEGSGEK